MTAAADKQTRIALFLPFLGGRGAHRVMLNLANGFAATGHKVDLLLAEAKGELLDEVSPAVRVIDLRSAGGVLRALPATRRYLIRERPEVLLTAMDYVNVIAVIGRAVFSPTTRLYLSCHTSLLNSARNSPRLRDRLLPIAVRTTYRYADGIIAVSSGVAETIAAITKIHLRKIHVIHNPAITQNFFKVACAPAGHSWLDAGEIPTILGVGSMTPEKDFGTLIRAFALVTKERPVRLMLLGEGQQRKFLEELSEKLGVAEKVAMPGWVPNAQAFMSRAAVLALSSRWEGFGLVLAEALACGTPVVSTDCPSGPAEILEGGRYGALVPMQDSEAMAQAILSILRHRPSATPLRRRGQDFSLERSVTKYLQVFGVATRMPQTT